jgi:signal transduction histidine kinase
MPPSRGGGTARAILTRAIVYIPDIREDHEYTLEALAHAADYLSVLAVPMLLEREPIGVIVVTGAEAAAFSQRQIELLQTFADQAVIAVENVRLFKELEAANRELEVASQHKSEFLANMSHELRTPLNAILGFSEVLSERMFGDLNDKQDEYLKDIHASGQHLLSLINDILDLSKIEAGRMGLELTDFDLPTAIDSALTLIRERASRRGITLHQAVDHRLGQIRGDERKIRQVLLNLLSNALKFTPEGGRIDVRSGLVEGMAEIAVTDTGVGIAPEDQEVIFEEFRQVGTAAKKVEGTGLGLALSRKFIELHRGGIRVESQVGVGSTFTFTLPLRNVEPIPG